MVRTGFSDVEGAREGVGPSLLGILPIDQNQRTRGQIVTWMLTSVDPPADCVANEWLDDNLVGAFGVTYHSGAFDIRTHSPELGSVQR